MVECGILTISMVKSFSFTPCFNKYLLITNFLDMKNKKKGLVIAIDAVVTLVEILGVGYFIWKWIEPTSFEYAVLFVCVWGIVAWIVTTLTDKLLSPLNKILDEKEIVEQQEESLQEKDSGIKEKVKEMKETEWQNEISEEERQAIDAKYKAEHQQATINLYNESMKALFTFINNLERFRWDIASPYENCFLSEQDAWEVAKNRPPFRGYLHPNYYSDNAFLDELDIVPVKELKEFIDKHRELAQSLTEWGIKYGITTQETSDRMDARNYITSCIMGPEFYPPIREKNDEEGI